jgi:predicted PurR-regulated permease PerM
MEKRDLIAILALIVGIVGVFIFSFNSRFQGLQDSIDSFRMGLTDQIDALKSDLERIEEILAVLEQRMDIGTKEFSDINEILDSAVDRLTDIEQALNQSQTPPPPPPPQPVSLVISHPAIGDEVDWITSVAGNSTGIVTNKTLNLFLLVYPVESGGPWFVQNRLTVNPDGSWSGLVYFGRNPDIHPEDSGDQFLLLAIVTTADLQPGETFAAIPESICQSSISGLVRK